MRCDFVSIFPEYFDVLDISLIGKARRNGLLDLRVHNLREYSEAGRVDSSPYGGGPGMVMSAEPWARAIEHIATGESLVVFPSPSGQPYSHDLAQSLSSEMHIVFCCGRYEGIDNRIYEWTATRLRSSGISIGDYVLNGGEIAALAILEGFVRFIPGVLGNPESLVEESYQYNLLEYPVYTKPAVWRGLEVPDILLSGNHDLIREWRYKKQLEITQKTRPDLYSTHIYETDS